MVFRSDRGGNVRFQSTRPVRGATARHGPPRSLAGCFNPRAPCGARLKLYPPTDETTVFQSTRPVRGATYDALAKKQAQKVSIHAPRAGRDATQALAWAMVTVVSIHAPRAGRDNLRAIGVRVKDAFQSTRPVRGATRASAGPTTSRRFNPRAPCGARLIYRVKQNKCSGVSIHAPRAGRDARRRRPPRGPRCFNPRAPCGARRLPLFSSWTPPMVSIHAPRAGRDPHPRTPVTRARGFNPRAPCGARPVPPGYRRGR